MKTAEHPDRARAFVADDARAHWHDESLWFVRTKRDKQAHSVPEWERLRELGSQIKRHAISRWPDYLEEFEKNATALGAKVHWAANAEEHNRIVLGILQEAGVEKVTKSKSMLTEEVHLNPHLIRNGIEVTDTDLGERIVQLREETPSHIVLPAIHLKREDVSETFNQHLGTEAGNADPAYLTEAARQHLREKFLGAEASITGVNFLVAETGGFVVCTNEGNADLGTSLPRLHIACTGIEKLVPRAADLAVYLRLLGRSATGQPITTYTSHFHGPRPGGELHIVLVDNGRSDLADDPQFRDILNCIRCGACINTCPVYRRSGGHSYAATVPGPVGSVLNPLHALTPMIAGEDAREGERGDAHGSLPFACSLCGSCTDVCPVKIPLHHQLLALRKTVGDRGLLPWGKRIQMKAASTLLNSPKLFGAVGKIARKALPVLPKMAVYNRLNAWGNGRDLPPAPPKSFKQMWRDELKAESAQPSSNGAGDAPR
ncbi:lactate utilization protein B [Alienimonas chondri]|uniref:Lactate utilization protein B n=1 Tax=Alienimonas chondri TaxID=2681879 RepID=A0ABX1VC52_9PLAN|nr:lactate utilization protein B [Alienimonas chondri]NNJ24908.1 Lactate utilization protein B [Alienimonas chondri]